MTPISHAADQQNDLVFRYDLIARITLANAAPHVQAQTAFSSARTLHQTLSKALGNRITSITVTPDPSNPDSAPSRPSPTSSTTYVACFALDAAHATRLVDRGPSSENATASADFRTFWGTKAELRRFKDGAILECAVWDAQDGGALGVTKQIIRFVLAHHFGEDAARSCAFLGGDFTALPALADINEPDSTLEDVASAFRELEAAVRALLGLPLQIRQLQLAESGARCAFHPASSLAARHAQKPLDVVLQFEGSSRWPDDLAAVQMTKLAFLLKLEELLVQSKSPGLAVRVGLENEGSEVLNRAFLDITYPPGGCGSAISFRIRIHHDRVEYLLTSLMASSTTTPSARPGAAAALADYKRNNIAAPLHAQAIRSLITRYPAFAPTVRAVHAWFASHLLVAHVAPELLELLVARVFLRPEPRGVPGGAMIGLLRTLLFLETWDWEREPLIVDFGSSSPATVTTYNVDGTIAANPTDTASGGADPRTNFQAWRKLDPTMARVTLFAATNFDSSGMTWTERRPVRVVAARMSGVARAACRAARERGTALEVSSLFKSPLRDFDFVVHLSGKFTAFADGKSGKEERKSRFKNLQTSKRLEPEMVGYETAALLFEELQRLFGDTAVFFHNLGSAGGGGASVIAGLWAPGAAQGRRWKVGLPWSSVPVKTATDEDEDGAEAVLNKEAVLAEIARLGGDIVVRVEANR